MPDLPDVGLMMREIQAALASRHSMIDRHFGRLLETAQAFLRPQERQHLDGLLAQANVIFPQLSEQLGSLEGQLLGATQLLEQLRALGEMPVDPAHISLEELARVPGASRSWLSPKRWIAQFLRLWFRRQEAFNLELLSKVRYLGQTHALAKQSLEQLLATQAPLLHSFHLQFAVLARLIGTLNSLVASTAASEQALAAWNRDLSAHLIGAFHDALSTPSALAACLGEEPAPLPEPPAVESPWLRLGITSQQLSELKQAATQLAGQAELRQQVCDSLAEQSRHVSALVGRLSALEAQLRGWSGQLKELGERVELQRSTPQPIPARPQNGSTASAAPVHTVSAAPEEPASPAEFDFLAFEALTRGEEQTISTEQQKYLEWFRASSNVLDGGCGRGEFLELLRSEGIDAYGVDTDAHMVEHCAGKGLRVVQAEFLSHLRGVEDGSLGGIFLGQVVEHLPSDQLIGLPALAYRKLRPGGAIVLETINPTCLSTFSGAFYADPTHVKPVHPKALEYLLLASGFGQPTVIYSAPVPDAERLLPLRETAPLEPVVKELLLQANSNLARLNSLLYSFGNYAIAARRPKE